MDALTIIGAIITVIGTAASIWGAVLALRAEKSASESATEAKRARDQLVNQRQTSELSELKLQCDRATQSMEKYGPSAVPTKIRGASASADSKEVQVLLQSARTMKGYFDGQEVEHFVASVEPKISRFVEAGSQDEYKSIGSEILAEIGNFHASVKSCLDRKKDAVSGS